MKAILAAVFLLCATSAFCQYSVVVPNVVSPVAIADHPLHASHVEMAKPDLVLQDTSYTHEKGVRPLCDLSLQPRPELSLGEVARKNRQEQLTVKKSETVWVND